MIRIGTHQTDPAWLRALALGGAVIGFTIYISLAVFGALIFPPAAILFLAPVAVVVAMAAPAMRAAPKKLVMFLIYASALTLPLWPIYLHVKLGPAPILTPPRFMLYVVTALWLYDMMVSRLRRGQFIAALRRGRSVAAPVAFLSLLGLLSVPMAEGRLIAGQEFFRQTTIWLIPFLAAMTYVRRPREFKTIILLLTAAGGVSGAIAIAELSSGRLLANLLSPFIADNGEWLRSAQEMKIRDGVFRAQGPHTHPLSLGEFLALTAPIAFGLTICARTSARRLCWGLCLALIVAGAFATNSRGALLAIAIALTTAGAVFAYRFLKRAAAWRFRPAAGLAMALMLVSAPVLAVGAHGVVTGDAGASAARSSQSRIDQIEQAWPKIMKRPALGYGTGRAARVLGYWGATLTVDNYYLNLALDLGLPGPLALLAAFAAMGATALKRSAGGPRDMAAIYVGLAGAATALAVTRTIVSQTGNLSILYLLLGGMAGAAAMGRARRRPIDD